MGQALSTEETDELKRAGSLIQADPKDRPKGSRIERFDIVDERYADDDTILSKARARIRILGDVPLEVQIRGKKKYQPDLSKSIFFILTLVQKRPEGGEGI